MKTYFSIVLYISVLLSASFLMVGCKEDFISGPMEDFKQIASLEKPSQIRISNVEPTSLTISWKASKGAAAYRLYVSSDSLFYNILRGFPVSSKDTTYWLSRGVLPNKKLFIKLVAENLENEKSFFSETVSVKTPNADAIMYYTSNPFPMVQSIRNNEEGEIEWFGFNFQYYLGFGEKMASLTTDAEVMAVNTFDKLFGVSAANGDYLWRASVPGIVSMPLITNTQVMVSAINGKVYAYNKKSGTPLWEFSTGSPLSASPTTLNNTAFVGNDAGTFFAIDTQTGQQKWQYQALGSIKTNPCIYQGSVLFGTDEGLIYALNIQTGQEVWKLKTQKIVGSPAVAEGTVYFATGGGQVLALNAQTGTRIWLYESPMAIESSPNVGKNKVVFYDKNHIMSVLDSKTGRLLMSQDLEQTPTNGITITKFGKVYVPGLGVDQNEIWVLDTENGDVFRKMLDRQGRGQSYTPIIVQAGDGTFAYPAESGNQ
jgi:outer membrane protein assembly factor BamB